MTRGQPPAGCHWEGVRPAAGQFTRHMLSFLGNVALPALKRLPQHQGGWFEAFSCESRHPLRSGGTWCWWHFACGPQAQGPRQQMTACRHLGSQAQVEAGGLRVLDLLQLPEAVRSTPRWSPHAAAGRLSRSLAGWNKSRTCVHRCAWLLPSISFHRESLRTILCVLS